MQWLACYKAVASRGPSVFPKEESSQHEDDSWDSCGTTRERKTLCKRQPRALKPRLGPEPGWDPRQGRAQDRHEQPGEVMMSICTQCGAWCCLYLWICPWNSRGYRFKYNVKDTFVFHVEFVASSELDYLFIPGHSAHFPAPGLLLFSKFLLAISVCS